MSAILNALLVGPPPIDEPIGDWAERMAGVWLVGRAVARLDQPEKLEWLYRCLSRPAAAEIRRSLTPR